MNRYPWTRIALALWLAVVIAGCGDDGAGTAAPATTTSASTDAEVDAPTTTTTVVAAPMATVTGPITPHTPTLPQPATSLPEGYVEEEYFVEGVATDYVALGELAEDGMWNVEPDETADFRTRIVVRRPSADRFSGTVVAEWLNVTAIEASPGWGYLFEEIATAGHAYVAVSVQALGVVGGESLIPVEVDEEVATEAGADPTDADAGGLVNADPERYGTLTHPGDAYTYDIYTQVGRLLGANEAGVLGELDPSTVLAIGESQSAGFLTSYVNAVHPLAGVYDGFFVHSRQAGGAPLDGGFGDDPSVVDRGVRIRTDVDVPVFMVESETDITLLGYGLARQDDADLIRTWELAGTAHADAHIIRAILGGPRDASVGSLLNCENPINTGPHHEGLQAALRHLVDWSAGGEPPPTGDRLTTTGDPIEIVRDELGIALGGVRNPLVDVPVVVTTGDPWGDVSLSADEDIDVCVLFGQTIPIEADGLRELHGSAEEYLAAFDAAADVAVEAGFLLDYDADQLRAEAQANQGLFE